MERNKKVVFVSHCVLNQNTVVKPLARAKGAYTNILKEIINSDIGIHQLPCPEFRYLGLEREPMTKEQYDTFDFRNFNKSIAADTLYIIKEYINNGYDVLGIIGIKDSPTCSIIGNKGILMEEFIKILAKENIKLKLIDVPTDYHDNSNIDEFIIKLRSFLNDK